MIHAHRPIVRGAKPAALRTVCDELVDPMDRDMLSRQASTAEEARLQNVDCETCGEILRQGEDRSDG